MLAGEQPVPIYHYKKQQKKNLKRLELETNIYRIFISQWYLPPMKNSKKFMGKDDMPWMIWHGITQWSICSY